MSDDLIRLTSDSALAEQMASMCGLARIEFYRSIDSTQRLARARLEAGAPAWTLVGADFQTAGRGQHGRRWLSAPGSALMFSLILRPAGAEAMALIPIRAGIVIVRALEALFGPYLQERIRLKWPNDLMTAQGKLGGILCEGLVRGSDLAAIVGVGINVHAFDLPRGADAQPAFLSALTLRPLSRLNILAGVARALRVELDLDRSLLNDRELERFSSRDWLSGRHISQPVPGTVLGITSVGHLVVRRDDGKIEEATGGSVS